MIPYHVCTAPHPCVRAPICRTPRPKCLFSLYHCGTTIKSTAPALAPTPMGTIKLQEQELAVIKMALVLNYMYLA